MLVRSEILACGFDDFIAKPFRILELLEIIANQLKIEYTYDETPTEAEPEVTNLKELQVGDLADKIPSSYLETIEEHLLAGDLPAVKAETEQLAAKVAGLDALVDFVAFQTTDFNFDNLELMLEQLKAAQ